MNEPFGPPIKDGDNVNSASDQAYSGYRVLSQTEIRALATEIVTQVKRRGPFRSLAEFVNRTLPNHGSPSASSDWETYAMKGALEAAIEDAGINERFRDEMVLAASHGNFDEELKTAVDKPGGSTSAAGPAASHAPGYLTQADLLSRLGPCLSARSDTFRVRVYGEVVDASEVAYDGIDSHSRCEAIFQRLPDVAELAVAPPGSSSNHKDWSGLHRKFALVGFRWLRDNEI